MHVQLWCATTTWRTPSLTQTTTQQLSPHCHTADCMHLTPNILSTAANMVPTTLHPLLVIHHPFPNQLLHDAGTETHITLNTPLVCTCVLTADSPHMRVSWYIQTSHAARCCRKRAVSQPADLQLPSQDTTARCDDQHAQNNHAHQAPVSAHPSCWDNPKPTAKAPPNCCTDS